MVPMRDPKVTGSCVSPHYLKKVLKKFRECETKGAPCNITKVLGSKGKVERPGNVGIHSATWLGDPIPGF